MKVRSEENIPRRRTESLTFASEDEARRRLVDSEFCSQCQKLSLRSKADAHSYIGLKLAKKHSTPKPGSFVLMPYRCPHGKGWHIGRNLANFALLNGGKQYD